MDHTAQEVDEWLPADEALKQFLEAAEQMPRVKLMAEARAVWKERIVQQPKPVPVRMHPLTRAELDEMALETDRRISRKEAA